MLTDAEIAAIQETITGSLPDTCTVGALPAKTSDGAGKWTEVPGATATVACRVGPLSQNEAEIALRRGVSASWAVTLPAETVVAEGAPIVWNGHTLEVAVVLEYPYELSVHLLCTEAR